MDLAERFMGQQGLPGELTANAALQNPPSYQMLILGPLDLNADALTLALRAYHPSLAKAQAELMDVKLEDAPENESSSVLGLAGWGKHVVKLVGFNMPIPQPVFDTCVRPAHFSEQLKEDARAHKSHVILYYAGFETDPLEQFVALTVMASALARFDGILLLNESARSAFPAEALLTEEPDGDPLDILRAMPIPLLFGGFVKIEIEDEPGVWMRTFGNSYLNLPDVSFKAEGHHQGNETFDLFANVLSYLLESKSTLEPGHTMQVGDELYIRVRERTKEEWYLESEGEMLIIERISKAEVNRPAPG